MTNRQWNEESLIYLDSDYFDNPERWRQKIRSRLTFRQLLAKNYPNYANLALFGLASVVSGLVMIAGGEFITAVFALAVACWLAVNPLLATAWEQRRLRKLFGPKRQPQDR